MRAVFGLVSILACLNVPASTQAFEQTVPLRGRVVDAASGEPLPARVYVQSPDGSWHFARSASPAGTAFEYRKQRTPTSMEMHTTVSAHPFVVDVPPGRYTLRVERGKEYVPVERQIEVDDKPVEVVVALARWIDMASLGWYSGDTHVHRTLEELPNLLLAEDLNVALPLSFWVTTAYTPPGSGSKSTPQGVRPEVIQVDPTHVIYPMNTEYEIGRVKDRRHTLGAVFVLGHKTVLTEGVPPVGPVAERARREGALVDLDKHSWPWSLMLVPAMQVDLFELANNHCWRTEFAFRQWTLDKAPDYQNLEIDDDGFTEWGWIDFGFQTYYALLNCGFRLRPTAGTASGVHPVPLGFGRVYVHLPDGFSYEQWMAGLGAGRSFVTTGPMLTIEVDGHPPGATIRREPSGKRTVRITGSAMSERPLRLVEVVVNGKVAKRLRPRSRPTGRNRFEFPIDITLGLAGSSWIAVRVFEERPDRRIRFAHSSPVHVEVPGEPLRPRRAEVDYLVGRMQEELERGAGLLDADSLNEYRRAIRAYQLVVSEKPRQSPSSRTEESKP